MTKWVHQRAGAGMRGRGLKVLLIAGMMIGVAGGAGSGSITSTMETSSVAAGSAARESLPTLDDDPCWPLDVEGIELARVLEDLSTADARQLVWVMQNAPRANERLTLHLAIAHAETRGHILAVSASGAAGLAQATPIAILSEKVEGPLFVTQDYIRGSEAYFLKKPLGDADTIASFLLAGGRREYAANLLAAAWKLRREGLDELDMLEPLADDSFGTRRSRSEEENEATLERLGELIEKGASSNTIRRFRDETRARYRALRDVQRHSWRAYRDDLTAKRDDLLREIYGVSEKRVLETSAYDAGEILAARLDIRFSPTMMAEFMSRHLDTKRRQAAEMGFEPDEQEQVAIGLYNSGAPNIKRMMSGLIGSLPETEAYMRKVPGVKTTLESSLLDVGR